MSVLPPLALVLSKTVSSGESVLAEVALEWLGLVVVLHVLTVVSPHDDLATLWTGCGPSTTTNLIRKSVKDNIT